MNYTVLLLHLFVMYHMVESSSSSSSSGPITEDTIQDWIRARCGDTGSAIWSYEGTLYDPLDGRKICGVEGIELVRTLEDSSSFKNKSNNNRKSMLVAKDMKSSATILSRKLFCYQNPENELLTTIKLRPNAPKKSIPIDQSIALYDTATTVSTRKNGQGLILHTELPNGKCYWAITQGGSVTNNNKSNIPTSIDFTAYTKRQAVDLPADDTLSPDVENSNKNLIVSAKRPNLIQFGAAKTIGRFGARESYCYQYNKNNNNDGIKKSLPRRWKFWDKSPLTMASSSSSSCTVKYARYGEGPPWYGPGRYCTLELRGHRLVNLADVQALPASIAAELPRFLEVLRPITTDDEAKQAITLFRERRLQVRSHDTNDNSVKAKLKIGAMKLWNKVTAASTHKVGAMTP